MNDTWWDRQLRRFMEWDQKNIERAEARRAKSPVRRALHDGWQAVVFTVAAFLFRGR